MPLKRHRATAPWATSGVQAASQGKEFFPHEVGKTCMHYRTGEKMAEMQILARLWNKLSREAVGLPVMDFSRTWLEKDLSSLI